MVSCTHPQEKGRDMGWCPRLKQPPLHSQTGEYTLTQSTHSLRIKNNSSSDELPSVIDPVKALGAFRSQRGSLNLTVENSLTSVAVELYSKCIISKDALKEAMNQAHIASVRTVSLLSAVEAKIEAEPNVFAEFVSILQSEPTLRSQANKLKEQYFSK